jgi:hypothetical protein
LGKIIRIVLLLLAVVLESTPEKVARGDCLANPAWLCVGSHLAGMTDEDLGDVYDHLQTVPKLANVVDRRPPPVVPKPETAPKEAAE